MCVKIAVASMCLGWDFGGKRERESVCVGVCVWATDGERERGRRTGVEAEQSQIISRAHVSRSFISWAYSRAGP
jgi:hypothetical protein